MARWTSLPVVVLCATVTLGQRHAAFSEVIRGGVGAAAALQIGEDAIAAFAVQRLEVLAKIRVVVHHSQPELLGDPALLNHTRSRKYSGSVPIFSCQSVALLPEIAQNPSKLPMFSASAGKTVGCPITGLF